MRFDSVRLTWVDNASDELGIRVERATGSGAFQLLTTLPADTTSFTDSSATLLTSYTYRVRATGEGGASDFSNEALVTTPARSISFVLASSDATLYRAGVAPATSGTALMGVGVGDACSLEGRGVGKRLLCLRPGWAAVTQLDLETRSPSTVGFLDQVIDVDRQGLARSSTGTLYGIFGSSLRTIDPATWRTQLVSALTGVDRVEALVFHPDGTLLASASSGPDASAEGLYQVDLITGQLALVGAYGIPDIDDLAIGEDGLLYGVDGQSSTSLIYRIDRATAAASLVADTGIQNARGLEAVRFEAPHVSGCTRFLDQDQDAAIGPGDLVVVPFDQQVTATGTGVEAFSLLVDGDGFGAGATIASGPALNEVTIQLGTGARIRTRGFASIDRTRPGAASGIDATTASVSSVVATATGLAATALAPIDVVPGFVAGATLGQGHNRCLVTADLDSDGDLDLVSGDDGGANRVWINDGAGTLTDSGQAIGLGFTLSMAAGDVDRDGDVDLVFGHNAQADRVWLNDGAAVFTDSGATLAPTEITLCVALTDLDRDGDLDLLAGSRTAVHVYSNDGAGTFTETQTLATAGLAFEAGDVDRDGDLDVVVVDPAGVVRVLENVGPGTLVETGVTFGSGTPHTLCLVDLDRDGDLDLLVGYEGQADPIWLNDGAGTFTSSGRALLADTTWRLLPRDVDGDGWTDIVEACGSPSLVSRLWINDGRGNLLLAQELQRGNALDVAAGDLDRDGDLDLVFGEGATSAQGRITVLRGSLGGSWGRFGIKPTGQALGGFHNIHADWEDFDRDGDPDLLLGTGGHAQVPVESDLLLANDGRGGLSVRQTFAPQGGAPRAPVDFDHDGDVDVLRATNVVGSAELRYLVNDGSGQLTQAAPVLSFTVGIASIVVGDLDRDGHEDLVLTFVSASDRPRVYRNDGAGGFTLEKTLPKYARVVHVADLNGDSWLDLFAAEPFSFAGYTAFLNRRDGTFPSSGPNFVRGGQASSTLLDADRDGDLDLLLPGELWLNDGDALFNLGSTFTQPVNADIDFRVGDLDGDGDLDYATSGNPSPFFFFNDGAGNFTALAGPLLGLGGRPSFADVDRDGDLDIFLVAGGGSRPIGPTSTLLLDE